MPTRHERSLPTWHDPRATLLPLLALCSIGCGIGNFGGGLGESTGAPEGAELEESGIQDDGQGDPGPGVGDMESSTSPSSSGSATSESDAQSDNSMEATAEESTEEAGSTGDVGVENGEEGPSQGEDSVTAGTGESNGTNTTEEEGSETNGELDSASAEGDLTDNGDGDDNEEVEGGDDGPDEGDEGGDEVLLIFEDADPSVFVGLQGDRKRDACPKNHLLMGLEGLYDDGRIMGLRGLCARIEYFEGYEYLKVFKDGQTPWRGHEDGRKWQLKCPEHHVMTGLDLHASPTIRGIRAECAQLLLFDDDDGLWVEAGEPVTLDTVGLEDGLFIASRCEESFASGPTVSVSSSIAGLGLECRHVEIEVAR